MRAVAIAYNYETEKVMYTPFEGDEAGIHAMNWCHKDTFIWEDFPASEGWTHFYHCDQEAAEQKGAYLTAGMLKHPWPPEEKE